MTCPHLEETSALFDGRAIDRAHADACDECQAFLADAAALRESLQDVKFDVEPRRRLLPILVPAALVLCFVLFFALRETHSDPENAPGRAASQETIKPIPSNPDTVAPRP